MDLKTEMTKILEAYGCLEKHKNEGAGEVYNQIRNEDLVNDLFALYDVSNSLINEIKRRQTFIQTEPNGQVRETMIDNLLINL